MNADSAHKSGDPGGPRLRTNWVLVGFLAVAGFFLLSEHRAHLLGWLPWLLVLACPLMHLFHGHGGHGSHGGGRGDSPPDKPVGGHGEHAQRNRSESGEG